MFTSRLLQWGTSTPFVPDSPIRCIGTKPFGLTECKFCGIIDV
jgi:hypothetical protein